MRQNNYLIPNFLSKSILISIVIMAVHFKTSAQFTYTIPSTSNPNIQQYSSNILSLNMAATGITPASLTNQFNIIITTGVNHDTASIDSVIVLSSGVAATLHSLDSVTFSSTMLPATLPNAIQIQLYYHFNCTSLTQITGTPSISLSLYNGSTVLASHSFTYHSGSFISSNPQIAPRAYPTIPINYNPTPPPSCANYDGPTNYIIQPVTIRSTNGDFEFNAYRSMTVNEQFTSNANIAGMKLSALYLKGADSIWHKINNSALALSQQNPATAGMFQNNLYYCILNRTILPTNSTLSFVISDSLFKLAKPSGVLPSGDSLLLFAEYYIPNKSVLCSRNINISSVIDINLTHCFRRYNHTTNTVQSCMNFNNHSPNLQIISSGIIGNPPQTCLHTVNSPLDTFYMVIENTDSMYLDSMLLEFGYLSNAYLGNITKYIIDPSHPISIETSPYRSFPSGSVNALNYGLMSFSTTHPPIPEIFDYKALNLFIDTSFRYMRIKWLGQSRMPDDTICGGVQSNKQSCRITYQACGTKVFANGSAVNNNGSYNALNWTGGAFIYNDNSFYSGGKSVEGPGISNVIGNPLDNYDTIAGNGLPGTAVFFLPSINSWQDLRAHTAHSAIMVNIRMNENLNVWQGDINNNMQLSTNGVNKFRTTSYYDSAHLQHNIRFYLVSPPNSANCNSQNSRAGYCRIIPDEIGYTRDINYERSPSGKYYPTGTNCGYDDIVAIFYTDTTAGSVNRFSNMMVEMDIQPVCNSTTQDSAYNRWYDLPKPSKASVFPSESDIKVQVKFSPDINCNADASDTNTYDSDSTVHQAWVSNNNTGAHGYPENRYNLACEEDKIPIQCPGCHLAGLYNIGFDVRRMTYGTYDSLNRHAADSLSNPVFRNRKRVFFDQKYFRPVLCNTNNQLSAANYLYTQKVMTGDLFRVRVRSMVHTQESYNPNGNYAPSFTALSQAIDSNNVNHPGNIIPLLDTFHDSQGHLRHGFRYCYLRIAEITGKYGYVETYGCPPDSGLTPSMTNSIANVLVWFNPNDTGMLSARPISVFWDPGRDRTEDYFDNNGSANRHGYVFDLSFGRLDTLYRNQYGQRLPWKCYTNNTTFFADITFRTIANSFNFDPDAALEENKNKLIFTTKAYFTLVPETGQNSSGFIDLQDINGLSIDTVRHITGPAVSSSIQALEDLPVYLTLSSSHRATHHFPILGSDSSRFFPNSSFNNIGLQNIRWWCVRGEGKLKTIGYIHNLDQIGSTSGTSNDFCSLKYTTSSSEIRAMILKNTSRFSDFAFEYRNWTKLRDITITTDSMKHLQFAGIKLSQSPPPVLNSWNLFNPASNSHAISFLTNYFGGDSLSYRFVDSLYYPNRNTPAGSTNSTKLWRLDDGELSKLDLLTINYTPLTPTGAYRLNIIETENVYISGLGHSAYIPSVYCHIGGNSPHTNLPTRGIDNIFIDPSGTSHQQTLNIQNDSTVLVKTNNIGPFPHTLLPFDFQDKPNIRKKTRQFNNFAPGPGNMAINRGGVVLLNQNDKAVWPITIQLKDTNNIPNHVGNGPNPWVLLKVSADWVADTNGVVVTHYNGTSITDSFPFTTHRKILNYHNYDYYLFARATGTNSTAQWYSYFANTLASNSLSFNLTHNCASPLVDSPAVWTGFTCSYDSLNTILRSINTLTTDLSLMSSLRRVSCGFAPRTGAVKMNINLNNPTVNVDLHVQNHVGAGSFICDPTIINADIANLGTRNVYILAANVQRDSLFQVDTVRLTCLPDLTHPHQWIDSAIWILPTVQDSGYNCYHFGLGNPSSSQAPNGIPGNGHDNMYISVNKRCHLSYRVQDQMFLDIIDNLYCDTNNTQMHHLRYLFNPYLDNPGSTFNNFRQHASVPNPINDTTNCSQLKPLEFSLENLMSPIGAMGHNSVGANTLGGDNYFVVYIDSGYTVQQAFFLHNSTNYPINVSNTIPITDIANRVKLINYFQNCGTSRRKYYLKLPFNNGHITIGSPTDTLKIRLVLNVNNSGTVHGPPCSADICTGLFTLQKDTCSNGSCELFAPQSEDSISLINHLQLGLPTPHILLSASQACYGSSISISTPTQYNCGYYQTTVYKNQVLDTTFYGLINNHSFIRPGEYTIHASSQLVNNGLCSSPSSTTSFRIDSAVYIHVIEIDNVTCVTRSDGRIALAYNHTPRGIYTDWGTYHYSFTFPSPDTTHYYGPNGNLPAGWPAGNYSVTVTDGHGCTASGNYTISAPSPMTAAINQSPLKPCTNAFMNLTATCQNCTQNGTYYTYNWSNGSTNRSINTNSSIGGIYSLTITDSRGCSATTIDTAINRDCCGGTHLNYNRIFYNVNSRTLINSVPPHSRIRINGTLTIDSNIVINSLNITMGEGALIKVNVGKRLTINNSFIHGCDRLWKGIWLDPRAYLGVFDDTLTDAQFAVKGNHYADIELNRSIFSNNFIGVYLPYKTNNGNIQTLTFACHYCNFNAPNNNRNIKPMYYGMKAMNNPMDTFKVYAPFLPAYTSSYPYAGIFINNTNSNINIDNTSFDRLSKGVFLNETQRNSFTKCSFSNIQNTLYSSGYEGSGIIALGTATISNFVSVDGFINSQTPNQFSFNNCNTNLNISNAISLFTHNLCLQSSNGIYANNSTLTAIGNKFSNIGYYNTLANGIVASGNGQQLRVKDNEITGFAVGVSSKNLNTSVLGNYFHNMYKVGITAFIGTNLKDSIVNNRIDSVQFGINLLAVNRNNILIDSNRINSTNGGITCNAIYSPSGFKITNNNIDIGNIASPANNGTGINLQNITADLNLNHISGNSLIVDYAQIGILANTCKGLYLHDNSVKLNNTSYNLYGISLTGCGSGSISNGLRVNCNNIFGKSTTCNSNNICQICVNVLTTSNSSFKQNRTDNTFVGFRFNGVCDSTNFIANKMGFIDATHSHGHTYGLEILAQGKIGVQSYHANEWYRCGAKHNSNQRAIVRNSLFNIHSNNSIFLPPLFVQQGLNTYDFFVLSLHNPVSDSLCFNTAHRYNSIFSTLDQMLLDSTITFDMYEQAQTYQMTKDFYESLIKDYYRNIGTYPAIDSFLLANSQTTIGDFLQIDQSLQTALRPDLAILQEIEIMQHETEITIIAIEQNGTLLGQDNINIDSVMALIDAQKNSLDSFNMVIQMLKSLYEQKKDSIIAATADDNNQINISELYEENIKITNQIEMNLLASDSIGFSNDQLDDLRRISCQCPLAGGEGVYKARSLYALAVDTTYDDYMSCLMSGFAYRKAPIIGNDIIVNPNPADNFINIVLKDDGNLEAIDLMERSIIAKSFYNKGVYKINTVHWAKGIYILAFTNSQGKTTTKKILINH